MKLPESKLTKSQRKQFSKIFTGYNGRLWKIVANVRFDDECGNGHNTFAITADIYDDRKRLDSCGCQHEAVAEHFPELAPLIKWHLVSTDGPLGYIENTMYHSGRTKWKDVKNYDYARSTAVWSDLSNYELDTMTDEHLKAALIDRLPGLMQRFKTDIELLGFTY